MPVGEHNRVKVGCIQWRRPAVPLIRTACPLVHPEIDEDTGVPGFQEETRTGDLACSAMKSEFHNGSLPPDRPTGFMPIHETRVFGKQYLKEMIMLMRR